MDFIRSIPGFEKTKETELSAKERVLELFIHAMTEYFSYNPSDLGGELQFDDMKEMVNPNSVRGSPATYFKKIESLLRRAGYNNFKPKDLIMPTKVRTLAAFSALDDLRRKQNLLKSEAQLAIFNNRNELTKLNSSLEVEVNSVKTRLQHLEYALERVMGSSGGSRQQLSDEIDQLQCEIDEDNQQLDSDITQTEYWHKVIKDLEGYNAGLCAKLAAAKNLVAYFTRNQELSTQNKTDSQRIFELETVWRELDLYIEKLESSKRESMKHVDQINFKETSLNMKLHEVTKELALLVSQIKQTEEQFKDLKEFSEKLSAKVTENEHIVEFANDVLRKCCQVRK